MKRPSFPGPRGASALAALVLACVWLAGCGSGRRDEPAATPVQFLSQEARLGEHVFMRECHMCHPGGDAGLGPAINNKPLPTAMIKLQVRQGMGAMPEFGEDNVSSQELDALVTFLHALRKAPGPTTAKR